MDPYFYKLAADFGAQSNSYLVRLTVQTKELPRIWKSTFVLLSLKGADPRILNNYWPVAILSLLVKVVE